MTPRAVLEAARLLWSFSRGHRLRPWRSPYLRWRIETYSGLEADRIDARALLTFLVRNRGRLAQYLHWAGEMRTTRRAPKPRRPPAVP